MTLTSALSAGNSTSSQAWPEIVSADADDSLPPMVL